MPVGANVPQVVTVHDVAWLRVQSHARPYARAYFGRFALDRYRSARRIFVDSRFSRDELLELARVDPARVVVAYPGVAADVMSVIRARDDAAPFVLAVGTVEPRKNLELLVRALAALPQLRLVSAGPPTAYAERCRALAAELGVAARFELRGYVARGELLTLYASALAAAVPSTYEGFGYGAAQALCAGVPLLCSNAASLPEVAGTGVPLLEPANLGAWVEALSAALGDRDGAEDRARALRADACARFGWRATAEVVARTYRDAISESPRAGGR
jgi:glycosyltransferase involved in cell wall biosynthesis